MNAYYNELESFPCEVIRTNIERGRLPPGTIDQRDIKNVKPTDLVGHGQIHLFAGIGAAAYACRLAGLPDNLSLCTLGFPCQDLSEAGKGAGLDGARSGLFWEALRLIAAVRPTWVLIENVHGLRTKGTEYKAVELVIHGLEGAGYYVLPPVVVGADDIGATHRRKRVWIVARLANPCCQFRGTECDSAHHAFAGRETRAEFGGCSSNVADATQFASLNVCRISTDVRDENNGTHWQHRQFGESGSNVADTNGGRFRIDRSAQWEAKHADKCSASVGNPDSAMCDGCGQSGPRGWPKSTNTSAELAHPDSTGRREQCAAVAVPAQLIAAERRGDEWRWPARPGQPQHEWEQPRTVASPMGRATDGLARRLVRHRRDALKGLGNAWVPQTAVPILRWILATEMQVIAEENYEETV